MLFFAVSKAKRYPSTRLTFFKRRFYAKEPSPVTHIQELLGHKSSKTTEIYTHVSSKSLGKIKSPLDRLNLKKEDEK